MENKKYIYSLLFPIISIVSCIMYTVILLDFFKKYGIQYACCTWFFAGIVGGVIPIVLILKKRLDIHAFVKKKLLLSALYVTACVVTWLFLFVRALSVLILITPFIIILLEIRFSIINCKNTIDRIVVILSSPIIPYCGIMLDISHAFITTMKY